MLLKREEITLANRNWLSRMTKVLPKTKRPLYIRERESNKQDQRETGSFESISKFYIENANELKCIQIPRRQRHALTYESKVTCLKNQWDLSMCVFPNIFVTSPWSSYFSLWSHIIVRCRPQLWKNSRIVHTRRALGVTVLVWPKAQCEGPIINNSIEMIQRI